MSIINLVDREKFTWQVTLVGDDTKTVVYPFSSYWSPDRVSTESVAISAAAEASSIASKKYMPVGAVLAESAH